MNALQRSTSMNIFTLTASLGTQPHASESKPKLKRMKEIKTEFVKHRYPALETNYLAHGTKYTKCCLGSFGCHLCWVENMQDQNTHENRETEKLLETITIEKHSARDYYGQRALLGNY